MDEVILKNGLHKKVQAFFIFFQPKSAFVYLISVNETRSGLERKEMNMEKLVQKAKQHDKTAFTVLIEQNTKSMYKVAKAILKNDEDVADALQDTILTCWEEIGTLEKNEFFKTWLIRILINKCNVIYRQKVSWVSEEQFPEYSVSENQYTYVEWCQLLECLEEKYRIVIVLYYVEGFKVREIARILKVSESTVKGRLVTAREKVEKLYQMEGRVTV